MMYFLLKILLCVICCYFWYQALIEIYFKLDWVVWQFKNNKGIEKIIVPLEDILVVLLISSLGLLGTFWIVSI